MWGLDEEQLRAENRLLQDCHNQVCKQLVGEQEKNKNLEVRLKTLLDFIDDVTHHINRSIMAENHILSVKVKEIDELLNDLYEGLDEHYTEQLKKDDELDIARAEAQLELITSIINEWEDIK